MKSFNELLKIKCLDKNNRLCIGLDVDNTKLKNYSMEYMLNFIKDIIESTIDHCPIYKVNFSFYERHGAEGYKILKKIPEIINKRAITIADAKRGDIGNSSLYYAKSIFDYLNYDSVTVSPYMGEDSILPFIEYRNKGVFILCLTSNKGSNDFQHLKINDKELFKFVALKSYKLNKYDNVGLVIGATNKKFLKDIKKISKDLPWLMPGVGSQGGNLEDSIKIEVNSGLSIINVSRDIIYSGKGTIEDIRKASLNYTSKIREIL